MDKTEISRCYDAKVEEVHSGDDFILLVDLGVDGLHKRTRARLLGVDAPNAYRAKPDTEAGKVRDEVKRLVCGKCKVELVSEGKGGWIVILQAYTGDKASININEMLQSRGYVYRPDKVA